MQFKACQVRAYVAGGRYEVTLMARPSSPNEHDAWWWADDLHSTEHIGYFPSKRDALRACRRHHIKRAMVDDPPDAFTGENDG